MFWNKKKEEPVVEDTTLKKGKEAQGILRRAQERNEIPPNSRDLYRAMRKAGLDI